MVIYLIGFIFIFLYFFLTYEHILLIAFDEWGKLFKMNFFAMQPVMVLQ